MAKPPPLWQRAPGAEKTIGVGRFETTELPNKETEWPTLRKVAIQLWVHPYRVTIQSACITTGP